jgi:hypothetical protein
VVAFSCKGRGFCPSCGARRRFDTALWLVDRVIAGVAPVRQWVLSLPHRLRVLCAYDPDACALVRRVLTRAVSGCYEGLARRRSVPHAPGPRRRGGVRRHPWSELLRRVFAIDVLVCPHCGGVRRLLAAITAPDAIEKVLRAMGLSYEVPELAPTRAPPGEESWWGA